MPSIIPRLRSVTLLVVAIGLILTPGAAMAQGLTGRVLDAATARGIAGVHLVLKDGAGRDHAEARSGEDGAFMLVVPYAGQWTIHATRLGYTPLVSDPLFASPDAQVVIQVWMVVDAIELEEPVVVTESQSYATADLRDFQRRRDQSERTGVGKFITRSDIERQSPSRLTDVLRTVSGVRVDATATGRGRLVEMSGGCIPAVYVDGSHINRNRGDSADDFVSTLAIEGIEVYRGGYQQIGHYHDPYGCGLILVWTRRGESGEGGFSWARMGAGLAGLAALFLLF